MIAYNGDDTFPVKISIQDVKDGVVYLEVTYGLNEPKEKTLPVEVLPAYMRDLFFNEETIEKVMGRAV